jgi:hypothetical protein
MRKYMLITVWSGIFALLWITASFALFFDFENQEQLDQWEVLILPNDPENDQDASWQIANGALKLRSGGAWDLLALKDFEFTDGTIQYKLKWIEGGICEVGVFYRLEESPDLPHYHVHVSATDVPPTGVRWGYIEKVINGAKATGGRWVPTINRQIPGWGHAPVDKWFEFKIEVRGDEHVVYAGLEGQLEKAIEFRHDERRSGRVGLVNYAAEDTVLIDNFEVTPDPTIVAVERRSKLTTIWGKIKGAKLSLIDND